jgi:hypothetical protein
VTHSLDDENFLHSIAGLSAPRWKTKDKRSVTCPGSNGTPRERYRSKTRAVPFHDFTL